MTTAKPTLRRHPSARSGKSSKATSTPRVTIPEDKEVEIRRGERSVQLTNLEKICFKLEEVR
jgi:hypothetical protein